MSKTHARFAFSHTMRNVDGTDVVELRGEMDIRTAPSITALLDALTAGPPPDLVLDLRSTSFIDCTGLGRLCRARNRALARHGRFRLVSTSPHFLRILRCVHLAGVIEVYPGLSAALVQKTVSPATRN
ncbi:MULTISPECIES: STAS domain-containing protein [Streptomyces]|nr:MULTISPECIES: STAS domain-containing protein [Streptomyces]MDI5911609.1 STAS domain-containing protein [Streptomyces sp. 12257]